MIKPGDDSQATTTRTYRPVGETSISYIRGGLIAIVGLIGWIAALVILDRVERVLALSTRAQPWATIRIVTALVAFVPILFVGSIGRRLWVPPKTIAISVDADGLRVDQGRDHYFVRWDTIGVIRSGRAGFTTQIVDLDGTKLHTLEVSLWDAIVDETGREMTLLGLLQVAALDRLPPRYQRIEPDASPVLHVAFVALLVVIGIVGIVVMVTR